MSEMDETRFRSFAERYVIERASSFEKETAQNEAWQAINQALNIYQMIHDKALQTFAVPPPMQEQGQGPSAHGFVGATGAPGPGLAGTAPPPPKINSSSWTGRPKWAKV